MDYRIYHAINQFVYHHAWLGRGLSALENWAVPVIAIATFALWLLARPGGSRKWKLASACALGSAALALLVNQLIGKVWHRERPFCSRPSGGYALRARRHLVFGLRDLIGPDPLIVRNAPSNSAVAGPRAAAEPRTILRIEARMRTALMKRREVTGHAAALATSLALV